jgi:hypothetical protein
MLTLQQSREYNRAQKLQSFFINNADTVNSFQPFAEEVADFTNNLTALNALLPAKNVDATVITADKQTLEQQIADGLSVICGKARAYALKTGNAQLAAMVNYSATSILRLKDADLQPLVATIVKAIEPLLADGGFTKYGITQSAIDALVADATAFNGLIGKAKQQGSNVTVSNASISDSINKLHSNILQFDLLADHFQTTNAAFVLGYHVNSSTDKTGIRHNNIEGVVTAKSTGLPVAGATVALEGVNKSAISDLHGHYSIARIEPDEYTINIHADGFAAQNIIQKVQRGKTVELDVVL